MTAYLSNELYSFDQERVIDKNNYIFSLKLCKQLLDAILASIKQLKMAKALNKQLLAKIDSYRNQMKLTLFKVMMPNEPQDSYNGITLNQILSKVTGKYL